MNKPQLIVFDTTLRDGEQTPGVNLNLSEKLEIARQLEKLGVDVIEAGFPASSPGDFESVKAIAQRAKCGVAALCRCVDGDIERGWEALRGSVKPRLHLFLATSPIHMEYKLKKTPDEVFDIAVRAVTKAKSLCADVEFSCEDASRSDPAFLHRIVEAVIDAGATTVNIPDTVGYAMPGEFGALIRGIREKVPNIDKAILSVHCHDDLGVAVANTLSAVQNGARQVECTINGMGERAGNCSLEEVVMSIVTRPDVYDCRSAIDTTRITRASRKVSQLTSVPIAVCKAIVGPNAFAHESGIHQHGMLANPMTYEIMTPQSVGKTESAMVLGKHSGRHAFSERLRTLGYELSPAEIDDAFARFKELADRKKTITDDDIEALLTTEQSDVPEVYSLDSFQIQTGNKIKSLASVSLHHQESLLTEAAMGDGPIDAAYHVVERVTGRAWPLASYDIKAVTEGEDALGEVTVRVRAGKRLYTGRGLASDIIEASIRAYLNAINRALSDNA